MINKYISTDYLPIRAVVLFYIYPVTAISLALASVVFVFAPLIVFIIGQLLYFPISEVSWLEQYTQCFEMSGLILVGLISITLVFFSGRICYYNHLESYNDMYEYILELEEAKSVKKRKVYKFVGFSDAECPECPIQIYPEDLKTPEPQKSPK